MRLYFYIYTFFLAVISSMSYAQSHHPQDFLSSIRGSKNEGEQIYNHFCVNCHAQEPIIPLGAPRIGEDKDWAPRIKQGLAVLLEHTNQGLNAMPARGGCFECTDEQLALSIISMIPKDSIRDFLNELKAHKKNTK